MDKKTISIVGVVAIVAIVAVAAFVILNNNGGEEGIDGYPDTYLTVLGNADLDNDINSDDVKKIQKFIDDKTAESSGYKYKDYYMYDANNDKVIDEKDVAKVNAMIAAQSSGNWSAVKNVYYVNVDYKIASYDMTGNNKVITLIAPPLDTVLAMGGKDLVVGTDNRITTGKYHAEYATTLDFDNLIDVGSCNEPSTEQITNAAKKYNGVTVVCGTERSYGPTMEKVFENTNVQVVRIASWEYGGVLYGLMTAGYLLKMYDGALDYYEDYTGLQKIVQNIVKTVPSSKKAAGNVGAAAVYGYMDELSLLGKYTGEYATIDALDPYDSATPYLKGEGGGHGDTIDEEGILAMYQQYHLINLFNMIGTPFQVTKGSTDDAQSSVAYMKNIYKTWSERIGTKDMPNLNMCVTGYSFSSGVSSVLNELILCYYLYNEEFLAYFGVDTQSEAQDILAGYVDAYCESIGIDGSWSFYGEDHGGKTGTMGMNLLYCGKDDERNILYGLESGHIE